jgi:hypothetical protein
LHPLGHATADVHDSMPHVAVHEHDAEQSTVPLHASRPLHASVHGPVPHVIPPSQAPSPPHVMSQLVAAEQSIMVE